MIKISVIYNHTLMFDMLYSYITVVCMPTIVGVSLKDF